MSKYVIIEDDLHTVSMISSIVKDNFSGLQYCGNATSIINGVELIKTTQPELVFLDVNLTDGESFDILKQFPNTDFKIIFITSYSKFAVEAFKFSAVDFVLKPFATSDIVVAIEKSIVEKEADLYQKKIKTFFHNYNSTQKKIVLSNAEEINVVALENILFAISDNSYTTFYTEDNREILVSKPLKHFEQKLVDFFFFRVHQKYLINLHKITKFHKKDNVVVLKNGISIPVSQSKKATLLTVLVE